MRPVPTEGPDDPQAKVALGAALGALLRGTTELPASELTRVVDVTGEVLGAASARMLVADYGLRSLQELGNDGPRGVREPIEGTLAGRCFASGEIVVAEGKPSRVWIPLAEGSERLGVLELEHTAWDDDLRAAIDPIVRVLVLVLISKRRYTDVVLRGRRSEPPSIVSASMIIPAQVPSAGSPDAIRL
jgi:phosphoserine phosphatase RsbU/P